jgi:hypothetical protein
MLAAAPKKWAEQARHGPVQGPHNNLAEDLLMADATAIREHMEVIGADGVHLGTVDRVEGDRIKLTRPDSGSHADHHHYISTGLVADIEGDKIRLSANADNAALLEEEEGGEAISDRA